MSRLAGVLSGRPSKYQLANFVKVSIPWRIYAMPPLPGVLSPRRRFLFRRAAMGVELLKKGIVFNEIDYLHRSHFLHFNPRRAGTKK